MIRFLNYACKNICIKPIRVFGFCFSVGNRSRVQCQYRHYDFGYCDPVTCLTSSCPNSKDDSRCAWDSQCLTEYFKSGKSFVYSAWLGTFFPLGSVMFASWINGQLKFTDCASLLILSEFLYKFKRIYTLVDTTHFWQFFVVWGLNFFQN